MMLNKKIKWCLKQKRGVELVEPSDNLAKAYFNESEETLREIGNGSSKWDVIKAYYASYHALYAILMKCGVKCEIHDCSIELMRLIENFSDEDYEFLIRLKEKRIRVQYYLKKETLDNLKQVKQFVLKCLELAESVEIDAIRTRVKNARK